jgi:proteic killer suppression protein
MDIIFSNEHLRRLCSEDRFATRQLGKGGARKLKSRLADLLSAVNVKELVTGRPHPLKGDRLGQLAVNLDGACRLVFEPADDPWPQTGDGAIDWGRVTSVRIVFVGDYHG